MRPLALFCLLASLLAGSGAAAHTQLVAATPPADAVVTEAPREVVLEFSEPVQALPARWFPAGGGAPIETTPRPEGVRLVFPVPEGLGTGTQVLSWRVVSVDGHPVSGSHVFSIGAPSEVAETPVAAGPDWAAALGRGMLTVTLVFGAGGAVFARLVDRGSAPVGWSGRLALGAAAAVLPAAVLALGLQGADLLGVPVGALAQRAPWAAALASPFAGTAAASLLAGVSAVVALRRRGTAGWAGAAWGLAAVSFALFGHAATAPPRVLTAPAAALHAAAFVFWIGALPGLAERAAQGGGELLPTLRRFSALAVPLVGALVLSGAALAFVQVGRPAALVDTAYGRLLVAKLLLVALLLILAAINRFRLSPAIGRGGGAVVALRRSVGAEIVLGLMIVTLASGFRMMPPPRALAAGPGELHIHLHEAKTMAEVVLAPGRAGPNVVEIALQDASTAPLDPLEVNVAFADRARGVEPIRLAAVRDGPRWRAGPVQLPHGGDWTMSVEVLITDFDKETLEAVAAVRQ